MASQGKNYAVTDFSQSNACVLDIEGTRFEVTQCTVSYAKNDIPRAMCLVAVGRDARNVTKLAAMSKEGIRLTRMRTANIYLMPRGEWDPSGRTWPGSSKPIFSGYYVGMAFKKVMGKLQPVLHLIHWLADLAFSSSLSGNLHPSSPSSLTSSMLFTQETGAPGGDQGKFISWYFKNDEVSGAVMTDLCKAFKLLLTCLAQVKHIELGRKGACSDGVGVSGTNDRALNALKRIEGPGSVGDLWSGYDLGKALPLDTKGQDLVRQAVSHALCMASTEAFSQITMWDLLVSRYLPMFHLAIIPLPDRALIIPDTPALKTPWVKQISAGDYDSLDMSGVILQPLRGVAVYELQTPDPTNVCQPGSKQVMFSGEFKTNNEGMFMVIPAPIWMEGLTTAGEYAGSTSGMQKGDAEPSKAKDKTPAELADPVCQLFTNYAKSVYLSNVLRGRTATVSGKLRFDIAPGSIVKIAPKAELFSEGLDKLAVPLYGQVVRVSINISAENAMAGTDFELTHVRTEEENNDQNTSTTLHPLFTTVVSGAPLIKDWKFA